jgi:hypothetical protein
VTRLAFAPRYYGGPFLPVAEPDRDLPLRDPATPVPADVQARVEFSGRLNGERIIAPFRDTNSAEDILGQLFVAEGYPVSWEEEERRVFPTIQGLLAEVVDRLIEKMHRAKGPRRAWLGEAVSCARRAAAEYAGGHYAEGALAVRESAEHIRGSNRQRQRRPPILLGPGSQHGSE